MALYKDLSYENQKIDIKTVKSIQFSILGPEEILKRSVCEITKMDTYNGNEPVVNGLFDIRMGAIEFNKLCGTCGQRATTCPNHMGHITLAKPVFNAVFFDLTRKVLKCICPKCSKLRISITSPKYKDDITAILAIKNNQKRWETYHKFSDTTTKIKLCGDDGVIGCGSKLPNKIVKEGAIKIVGKWEVKNTEDDTTKTKTETVEFTAEEVLSIFMKMSDEDIEILGFNANWNRPEWMICTILPVPPPSVRPSIIEENGQRREDDLTHKLGDIIKFNNILLDKIAKNASQDHIDSPHRQLQYHVFTFINNEMPGVNPAQQRNGRNMKSVSHRMKKKEGRIRGNLNAKRVDQSARSVITPDPNISIDELGIPIKIAMNLTFPEVVNQHNILKMKETVLIGPESWPGAKYIRKKRTGLTINIKYGMKDTFSQELEIGDIVYRHMINDDYVLFNRQPSLHKMSMMCHKAKIMPYQTFRLNVLDTPPYNADFDGDEMNLHFPQSVQTMGELRDLAAIPYMIISSKCGTPIIELVQDTLVGVFRLTKQHVRIDDKTMANLQMVNSYFKGSLDYKKAYDGQEAFSEILPKGLFLECINKQEQLVILKNSKLDKSSGTLDQKIFHSMSNGLIPTIFHDYGPFEVQKFLDNTQRLICRWLMTSGFSVGISDLVISPEKTIALQKVIHDMKEKAYKKLEEVRRGKIENNSILDNESFVEGDIINILNKTNVDVFNIGLSKIDDNSNRMINMIKSGSKGKDNNLVQMIGCVGQQNVEGKRIGYGFTGRTLPHYTKYDDGPEARGFVENSFINGLTPQEVFFHAMGGREGLIDTAVKTSDTGYIQRRLVKSMEDTKIYYDHTVRNASGTIIQYIYGEDGMDGTKIEKQFIPTINMNPIDIAKNYLLSEQDILEVYMTKEAIQKTKKVFDKCTKIYEEIVLDREFLITKIFTNNNEIILYPIPFARIIKTAIESIRIVNIQKIPKTDLDAAYILNKINELIELLHVKGNEQSSRFLHILLRLNLNPKIIIIKHHMTLKVFDWVIDMIIKSFKESIAHSGEMVGIVAAQTIGEMGTQMTLNSFHVSGTAAAVQATSGVPRFKEILSVSKNIKTPTMMIYLNNNIARVSESYNKTKNTTESKSESKMKEIELSKEFAINIKNTLEITRLCDILTESVIYYDKKESYATHIDEDKKLMDLYRSFEKIDNGSSNVKSTSNWVIRMKFDKYKMSSYGLRMIDIHTKLNMNYNEYIDCVYSDDNADECIMRIKLVKKVTDSLDTYDNVIAAVKAMENNLVYNVLLKGIKGIKKVSLNKEKNILYNKDIDQFENVTEWVFDTDGTNMLDLLTHPEIDSIRTRSNDIREIYELLGVEAARKALSNELVKVIGVDMNYRHLSLLIDTITNRGNLMSIDRHGLNRSVVGSNSQSIGPLAKASFEETTDMLVKACSFGELDRVNGVSSRVMLGSVPEAGTGTTNILLDEDYMLELMKALDNFDFNSKEGVKDSNEQDNDIYCGNIAFDYTMPPL